MQLSESKTYRTRDGSRTGIRVQQLSTPDLWQAPKTTHEAFIWWKEGSWICANTQFDLVEEEQPAERPFSYDACPVGEDGRRRAVTRDGREVVLLADDCPGARPIFGWIVGCSPRFWKSLGTCGEFGPAPTDLLVPPPPRRVVWVNLYENGDAVYHPDQLAADAFSEGSVRIGNRAYPIEID